MRWLKKYMAVVLTQAFILTGCMDPAEVDKPELLEPVSRNSVCCPVEKGRIGETGVLLAVVMPTEYAHFFKSAVVVEEIMAEVGDHVKKGQILASADTREAKKRKKDLENELAQEQKTFALKEKISIGKQEELRISGGKTKKKEMAVMAEDIRYEKQLYTQRIADLKKQIRKEEKKIQAGTLRARHSGYVTFRKNLSVSPKAEGNENIVAVADRKETYLELTDETTEKYPYGKYEVKYILSEGKMYPVKEIPYTQDELAVADRNKTYPPVRLSCPEKAGISSGDTCLVYFREKDVPEVLVVGNDSLHTQGEEYYVYVRGAGGEEKRVVTIGEQDDHRTEIRSGLKEGEMVCYSSNAAMPVEYEIDTVERRDFEIRSHTGSCRFADASPYVQLADREGLIVKSAVSTGDKVKKGDLLYVVDTGAGEAEQAELSYKIQKENETFRETLKGIQKQADSEQKGKTGKLRRMIKKRWQYERQLAEYTHSCTLKQLHGQLKGINKGNDGSGRIKVYAEYGGKVENCQIKVGERISVGTPVLTIRRRDKTRLLILSIPESSAKMQEGEKQSSQMKKRLANVGERISLFSKGKKYKGVCTGYAVYAEDETSKKYPDKIYLTTEGGKSYLGGNERSGYKYPGYYVELEGEEPLESAVSTWEATYSYVGFGDALTVPAKSVHKDNEAGKEDFYYVWRLSEGGLVKQYVTLEPALNDGADQVIFSGLEPGDQIAG